MDQKQERDRDNVPTLIREHPLLWAGLCINLWPCAILGPFFTFCGVLSLFVNGGDALRLNGQPVRTVGEKVAWIACSVLTSAVGVAFAVWHVRARRRWHRRPGRECLDCGYDLTGNVSGVCPECGGHVPQKLPPEEDDPTDNPPPWLRSY